MSDLRALMKAQKSSNRIQHPYARYNNAGALSCSLCSLPLKSEVLWPSHLTSKTHRNNLKREKEEQDKAAAATQATSANLKRPVDEISEENGAEEGSNGKRARTSIEDEATDSTSFLPAGFFSNPAEASQANADATMAEEAVEEPVDEEWAAFEATLNQPEEPVASTSTGFTTAATITAQPVLFEDEEQQEDAAAGQTKNEDEEGDKDDEAKETEEERREREEREELMERIETYAYLLFVAKQNTNTVAIFSEEREQQEADERVDALKKRLLAVRSSRKAGTPSTTSKGQVNGHPAFAGSAEAATNGARRNRRNRW